MRSCTCSPMRLARCRGKTWTLPMGNAADPSRRDFLRKSAWALACAAGKARGGTQSSLDALEAELGGRIGLAAIDTRNGKTLKHRADERFAMCSTFKWTLAAAVLAKQ